MKETEADRCNHTESRLRCVSAEPIRQRQERKETEKHSTDFPFVDILREFK